MLHVWGCTRARGLGSPRARVTMTVSHLMWATRCRFWESNWVLWKNQYVILTAKPSLQPMSDFFFYMCCPVSTL